MTLLCILSLYTEKSLLFSLQLCKLCCGIAALPLWKYLESKAVVKGTEKKAEKERQL